MQVSHSIKGTIRRNAYRHKIISSGIKKQLEDRKYEITVQTITYSLSCLGEKSRLFKHVIPFPFPGTQFPVVNFHQF